MLSLEALIVNRLTTEIIGLKTVGNGSKWIANMQDIGPILPACFVIPGGGEPVSQGAPADPPLLEQQEWDVVITVAHQATDSADGMTEAVAGQIMSSVLTALHGWKASPAQRLGFIYIGRETPIYHKGYAEFPMTFLANAVIGKL